MERYWPSYREEYVLTDSTVYKNGSLAKLRNGARVRISGRAYTASVVQFLGGQPAFNAEVLPISRAARYSEANGLAVRKPFPFVVSRCGQTWLLPWQMLNSPGKQLTVGSWVTSQLKMIRGSNRLVNLVLRWLLGCHPSVEHRCCGLYD